MSNRKKRAAKSRARVIEIKAKLGCKGATRSQIIATVQEKYPEIVRVENADLVYLGLMSIVNGVFNLKGGSGSSFHPDLFPGYDVPQTISLREFDATNGGTRNVEKNFDAVTKAELRQYLDDHKVPRRRKTEPQSVIVRFFDFIKDHGDDSWTTTECWNAARRSHAVK
jgi:hypothetical protein